MLHPCSIASLTAAELSNSTSACAIRDETSSKDKQAANLQQQLESNQAQLSKAGSQLQQAQDSKVQLEQDLQQQVSSHQQQLEQVRIYVGKLASVREGMCEAALPANVYQQLQSLCFGDAV